MVTQHYVSRFDNNRNITPQLYDSDYSFGKLGRHRHKHRLLSADRQVVNFGQRMLDKPQCTYQRVISLPCRTKAIPEE
jgi:hypothetical protein